MIGIVIGSWLVAFVIAHAFGAARWQGGSNGIVSTIFATGVALIVWGLL